jgi:hypothetical protein
LQLEIAGLDDQTEWIHLPILIYGRSLLPLGPNGPGTFAKQLQLLSPPLIYLRKVHQY